MKLKILKLLNFFIEEMMEAIDLFYIQKRYDLFDPHVGDTLCQIRAYKILLLAQMPEFLEKVKLRLTQLSQLHQKIQKIVLFLRILSKNILELSMMC